MARSVWKGPFIDGFLLKKAEKARSSGRHEMIKIWSRRSTILPQFVKAKRSDSAPAAG
jgi:small subunit ribosomal protein S19